MRKSPKRKPAVKSVKKKSAKKVRYIDSKKSSEKKDKQIAKKSARKTTLNIKTEKEKNKSAKIKKISPSKKIKTVSKEKTAIKKSKKETVKKTFESKITKKKKLEKAIKPIKKITQKKKQIEVKSKAKKQAEKTKTIKKISRNLKAKKKTSVPEKLTDSLISKKAKIEKILMPEKIGIEKEKPLEEKEKKTKIKRLVREKVKTTKKAKLTRRSTSIELKKPEETTKEKKIVGKEKKIKETKKIEKTKKLKGKTILSIKEIKQATYTEPFMEIETSAVEIREKTHEKEKPELEHKIIEHPISPVETLPSEYGENGITLIVVDPYKLFAFWEVKEDTLNIFKGDLILKVFDITDKDPDCEDLSLFLEKKVSQRIGDMYIDVLPGKKYIADIGIIFSEGIFISVARSNIAITPEVFLSEEETQILIEPTTKIGY